MEGHPQTQGDGGEQAKNSHQGSEIPLHHCLQGPDPAAESKDPSLSERAEQSSSDESMTDVGCTAEDTLLLLNHEPIISQTVDKDEEHFENPVVSNQPVANPLNVGLANGAPPICSPPVASVNLVTPSWTSPQKCNGHNLPTNKKRLSSSTKSQYSLKANPAQIGEVAGDGYPQSNTQALLCSTTNTKSFDVDCCAHCVLACLFCELTSLCSVCAQCLMCERVCVGLGCCSEAATGGLACCGEDACSALLDCGILEDCCQSSDCLEICLECCAICFPA